MLDDRLAVVRIVLAGLMEPEMVEMALATCDESADDEIDDETEDSEIEDRDDELGEQ
jgi:hypothetical protein